MDAKGFTLIEVIVSLVILGILTMIAGMGIVAGLNSWETARENVHISQKAQLAMSRVSRELTELTEIIFIDHTLPYLIIRDPKGNRLAVVRSGSELKLVQNPASDTLTQTEIDAGDILTDRINGFTINYYSGTLVWDEIDIKALSTIGIHLSLKRQDTIAQTFDISTLVHPRNTGNYGGASSTSPPVLPSGVSYCFITTAAGYTKAGPVLPFFKHPAGCSLLLALFISTLLVFYFIRHIIPLSVHRAPHLLCYQALEVQQVRLRTRRLASTAPCKRLQGSSLQYIYYLKPREQIQKPLKSIAKQWNKKGAALLGLISMLLVFSALGAAIVPFVSTSQLHRAGINRSDRAYFLAESGYRHAASLYLNAGSESNQDNQLANMDNNTYILLDAAGSFALNVYPLYFIVSTNPSGNSVLDTTCPGTPPEAALFSGGGRINIDGAYYTYGSAGVAGNQVQFNMTQPMPSINVGEHVFPAARALSSGAQTITNNGDLLMETGSGNLFPLGNGEIVINSDTYAYREYDAASNRLIGITKPDDPHMPDFSLPPNTDITLNKFIKLDSTGVFGDGDMQVSRTINYHIPLPDNSQMLQRVEFHETFNTADNWTSIEGTHTLIDADNPANPVNPSDPTQNIALHVSGAPSGTSIAGLDMSSLKFNASRFDVQTKIGFISSPSPPTGGYNPEPVPLYYACGLLFRLQNNLNTYGLSYLRGDTLVSNIDPNLTPSSDTHYIVLWQATSAGADKDWIAYKQIGNVHLISEDVENLANGWTSDGLWNITDHRSQSPTHSWYYGRPVNWDYNTGSRTTGSLTSPVIDLDDCDFQKITLTFKSWYQTESGTEAHPEWVNNYDYKYVEVSEDGGDTWPETPFHQILADINNPTSDMGAWQDIEIDLSQFAGKSIKIRFKFDSRDGQYNEFEGWYVDDIILKLDDFSVDKSTLLVSFREADSIYFDTGGTDELAYGDKIIGQLSNASATVYSRPSIEPGYSWAAGNAKGMVLVKNVNGTFTNGERLTVPGKSDLADFISFNGKSHFIKAYYGTHDGCGSPNTDKLDVFKMPNPIGASDLIWPPDDEDDWSTDHDAYTMIQWDAINATLSTISTIPSVDEPSALIRSTDNDLVNDLPTTLGLVTFGAGSTNIFFDDFGYQTIIGKEANITHPIQF